MESGSQAARCCGVHCCAAAGKDANVSARQKAAERPATTRRFRRAVQILIVESVLLPSAPVLASIHDFILSLVSSCASLLNGPGLPSRPGPKVLTEAKEVLIQINLVRPCASDSRRS